MKIATINIPVPYIESLDALVDLGLFASRSEAIRECLNEFLKSEPETMALFDYDEITANFEKQELYLSQIQSKSELIVA